MVRTVWLRDEDKIRCRKLYEICFPEDSVRFIDYYYREKCADNRILAAIDEKEEVVSMIHANPFTLSLYGQRIPVPYLVCVGTAPEWRRQGLMRGLMEQILRDSYSRGEAFSFLMPASPAYYTPMGFRYWKNQLEWTFPVRQVRQAGKDRERETPFRTASGAGIRPAEDGDAGELAEFANRILAEQADLFVYRDPAYYRRLLKEQQSENGGILMRTAEDGRVTGSVCWGDEGSLEFREPIASEGLAEGIRPLMMGRIVHLERFVEKLRFSEPFSAVLSVRDEILPENTGVFRFSIDSGHGCLRRVADDGTARIVDIAGLGEYLFARMRIYLNELV